MRHSITNSPQIKIEDISEKRRTFKISSRMLPPLVRFGSWISVRIELVSGCGQREVLQQELGRTVRATCQARPGFASVRDTLTKAPRPAPPGRPTTKATRSEEAWRKPITHVQNTALEAEMQSACQVAAGVGLRSDSPEGRRSWANVGRAHLCMVERVECIHARRQDEPLKHHEILQSGEVEVVG